MLAFEIAKDNSIASLMAREYNVSMFMFVLLLGVQTYISFLQRYSINYALNLLRQKSFVFYHGGCCDSLAYSAVHSVRQGCSKKLFVLGGQVLCLHRQAP